MVPVLDVRGGRVVLARGGSRAGYRPVSGRLAPGDDPLTLAEAFRDRLGCDEVYVADLDAIEQGHAAEDVLRRLAAQGFAVLADVGLRDGFRAAATRALGVGAVVAATETLAGHEGLLAVVAAVGPGAVVFGLDLRDGRPLTATGSNWPDPRPEALADRALAAGIRRVLLIDLARVGSGRGVGTSDLLGFLKRRDPGVEVLVGGGVAGGDDLRALRDAGADAVLVGSALHDGRVGAHVIARVTGRPPR